MKRIKQLLRSVSILCLATTVYSQTYFIKDVHRDFRRQSLLTDIVELDNGNFTFVANERELGTDPIISNLYLLDPCGELIKVQPLALEARPSQIYTVATFNDNIIINGYSSSQAGLNYYAILTPDSLEIIREFRDAEHLFTLFSTLYQHGENFIQINTDDDSLNFQKRNSEFTIIERRTVAHNYQSNPYNVQADSLRIYLHENNHIKVYDHDLQLLYDIKNLDPLKSVTFLHPKVIGLEKLMMKVVTSDADGSNTVHSIVIYDGDRIAHEVAVEPSYNQKWNSFCFLSNDLMVCPTSDSIYTYNLEAMPLHAIPLDEEDVFIGIGWNFKATKDGGFVFFSASSKLIGDFWQPFFRVVKTDRDHFTSFTPSSTCLVNTNEIEKTFKIYPTPATDHITIENTTINTSVLIYDLLGKQVQQETTNQDASIDISGLKAGIYLLRVGNQRSLQKIIKL